MTSNQHRLAFAGFGLCGLLFLALYLLLACNNRPAADDYYFLHAVATNGIASMSWTAYTTWITRWTTLPLTGLVLASGKTAFFVFPLLTLLVLFALCAGWIKEILVRSGMQVKTGILLLYALLFVMASFFLTVRVGETWYWITCLCMYMWPFLALLAGMLLLLRHTRKAALLSVGCFLFIGGGSEVVALEALLMLAGLLAADRRNVFYRTGLKWAALTLIVSLGIAWLGPGRAVRQEALPSLGAAKQAWLAVQSTGYFLLLQVPVKIHWMFFLILPWIVLRRMLDPSSAETAPQVFSSLFRLALLFIGWVFVHVLVVTLLLKSLPPPRTAITLCFGLATACAWAGWKLGALWRSDAAIKFLSGCFVIGVSGLLAYELSTQSELTSAYAHAYDQRMQLLENSKQADGIIAVPALPDAGMLYSAEISSDTAYFTNHQLRDYLGLKGVPQKSGQDVP